jgi:hypothetical protein
MAEPKVELYSGATIRMQTPSSLKNVFFLSPREGELKSGWYVFAAKIQTTLET